MQFSISIGLERQDWIWVTNDKVYLEQTRGEAGVRLESGELQAGRNEAGRLEVLIHKNTGKRKQRPDT